MQTQRPPGLGENVRDSTVSIVAGADRDTFREMNDDYRKVEAWAYVLPVLAMAGGAVGAVKTIPYATTGSCGAVLTKAVDEMDLQQGLARQVLEGCRELTPEIPVVLGDAPPAGRSIFELQVKSLALVGAQTVNPPLFLRLVIGVRLRRAGQAAPLYESELEYTGGRGYELADWARADAARFHKEIDRELPRIADRVVQIMFVDEPIEIDNLYSVIRD
jgi:hypothetical protein